MRRGRLAGLGLSTGLALLCGACTLPEPEPQTPRQRAAEYQQLREVKGDAALFAPPGPPDRGGYIPLEQHRR